MKGNSSISDNALCTSDHEWLIYSGSAAYVGVCDFKLSGIKQIDRIEFNSFSSIARKGSVIATIISEDYKVPVHMPIDGWVLDNNAAMITSPNIVLSSVKNAVWIAKIMPVAVHGQGGLINFKDYIAGQKTHHYALQKQD